MRTTLTLEEDVAILLERLRKQRGSRVKELVNEALRQGLRQMEEPAERKTYSTTPRRLGRCLIGSIDDVADAVAAAEGEDYR